MVVASLPRYVAAPALVEPKFGLLSVINWRPDADPHDMLGIQYQPENCGPAKLTSGLFCRDEPDSTPYGVPKTTDAGIPLVVASPFAVYGTFKCSPIGLEPGEAFRRARENLRTGRGRAIERAIQLGEPGNEPAFISEATDITPGATAVSIATAVGVLEQYARKNYGGTAVIHMSAYAATLAFAQWLLVVDGAVVRTNLGTPVAIGGGYDDTIGPTGNTTTGEEYWLYVTGAVYGWAGEVGDLPDTMGGALDQRYNNLEVLSEQMYVIAWECITAAVGVDASL